MVERRRVLILCAGNSARSQMAEGLLLHGGGEVFEVESAGVPPRVRDEIRDRLRDEFTPRASGTRT